MGTDYPWLGSRKAVIWNGAALVSIRRFDPSAVAAASLDFGLDVAGDLLDPGR